MSKIKFDMEDFCWGGELWTVIDEYADNECLGMDVDEAVQRLIKKYVKRERKRLARVMQHQQKIAIDGFLENLAADWRIPVRKLTGNGAPIGKAEESELEHFFTREPKPMNWPADFPGKH